MNFKLIFKKMNIDVGWAAGFPYRICLKYFYFYYFLEVKKKENSHK